MSDCFAEQMRELLELCEDARSNVRVVENSARHLLLEFRCQGLVRRPDGTLELVPSHLVRFVRPPDERLHGLLPLYEQRPDRAIPFHPNISPTAPHVVCASLETSLARGGIVPLWSCLNLVYDIIAGAEFGVGEGVFSREAAEWYVRAEARGELPFDRRPLI